jgi:glycosyltransferase involved in cell wall biosynthesis
LNYRLTGIGYYSLNLFNQLFKYISDEYDLYILVLNRNFPNKEVRDFIQNYESRIIYLEDTDKKYFQRITDRIGRGKNISTYLDYKINRILNSKSYENFPVFFGQDLLFDRFPKKINITTIHDLTTELYPEWHDIGNVKRNFSKLKFIQKTLDWIVFVSNSTKKDYLRFYHLDLNYSVIHPVIDSRFLQTQISFASKIKKKPYLLSVCTFEPRKNLIQVLKLFEEFKKTKVGKNFELILVGDSGWKNESIYQAIHSHQFKKDIILKGYLEFEELIQLYSGASVFIYLSKYEGFGMPVLEAVLSETLVLASNNSSIPEILGMDYPALVELNNDELILEILLKMITEEKFRKVLLSKIKKRKKIFQNENQVKEFEKIFSTLARKLEN